MSATSERRHQIQTISLVVLATLGVGFALRLLADVMVPFVLATFIALALGPLIEFQTARLRLPRPLAILATFLLGVGILILLGGLIYSSLTELAANAASYQEQVRTLVQRGIDALPLQQLGVEVTARNAALSMVPVDSVRGILVGTTNAIIGFMSSGVIVMIFLLLLLLGGIAERPKGQSVWAEIQVGVQRYLLTKMLISGATGILVGGTLAMLGVDLALVFGLLAFLLNFIPSVGSIIATLLPLPVVLMSPEIGAGSAVLAIAIPGAIQLVIGNFIDPMVVGESLDLNPVVILLSLMLWGVLWGVLGMFLAVPLTAVIRLLLSRFEPTEPLAEMLAGRFDGRRRLHTG